jgi:hypothetical protein
MNEQNEMKYLIVDARVRYWEDAEINGVEDEQGDLVPFRDGDSWKPTIDLENGTVQDWPQGTTASIHYKVCDDGDYWLADSDGVNRMKWKGNYVPDNFLCFGDEGYGDYIIFKIDESGKINNWKKPTINASEWDLL